MKSKPAALLSVIRKYARIHKTPDDWIGISHVTWRRYSPITDRSVVAIIVGTIRKLIAYEARRSLLVPEPSLLADKKHERNQIGENDQETQCVCDRKYCYDARRTRERRPDNQRSGSETGGNDEQCGCQRQYQQNGKNNWIADVVRRPGYKLMRLLDPENCGKQRECKQRHRS